MAARITETNVKNADKLATLDKVLKVRGSEKTSEMAAVTTTHTMLQVGWPATVLRYVAPVKQCRP